MGKNKIIQNRPTWNSSIGFVLAAAGSAIGLGNIWKFPYVVGKYGGAAFVVVYLIMIVVLGFPFVLAELALGRHAQTNMVDAYKTIDRRWGFVGVFNFLASFFLLSYYGVLGGWVLNYLVQFLKGGIESNAAQDYFSGFTASALPPIGWMAVFIAGYSLIVSRGVQKGIEKFSDFAMPLLFVMMLIVGIRSVTLPGASEGVAFFLRPDLSKITLGTIAMATSQAFYSLSLGMGAIITYGSYVKRGSNIIKMSAAVPVLDTVIALLAGFAILPAVFSFGYDPEQGPGLLFVTLPSVFSQMKFGTLIGLLFFVLVLFAAVTSAISLLENLVTVVGDKFHLTRSRSVLALAPIMFLSGVPSALAFGALNGVQLFGKNLFELVDILVSQILLPISSLLLCVFVTFVWRPHNAIQEITSGGKYRFSVRHIWVALIAVALPVVIVVNSLHSLGLLRF